LPFLLVVAALSLVGLRGTRGGRRAAGVPLALAAATVAIPLLLAIASPSRDYFLARNLIPAVVPLLAAVAIGVTVRGARRVGLAVGAALLAYSLGFSVWASVSPALQRPDWNSVAAAIGEPTVPRAMVTWKLGEASLRYYLSTGSIQVQPSDGFRWWVGEIDFISDGEAPPPPGRLLGPGFHEVGYEQVGRLYVRRFATPGAELRLLRLRTIREAQLGFRANGVLLDGIGPG
jgi:hypothetical protein